MHKDKIDLIFIYLKYQIFIVFLEINHTNIQINLNDLFLNIIDLSKLKLYMVMHEFFISELDFFIIFTRFLDNILKLFLSLDLNMNFTFKYALRSISQHKKINYSRIKYCYFLLSQRSIIKIYHQLLIHLILKFGKHKIGDGRFF